MWPKPQETADLVTFTEEIHNRKFNFLCSALTCHSLRYCFKWQISFLFYHMQMLRRQEFSVWWGKTKPHLEPVRVVRYFVFIFFEFSWFPKPWIAQSLCCKFRIFHGSLIVSTNIYVFEEVIWTSQIRFIKASQEAIL